MRRVNQPDDRPERSRGAVIVWLALFLLMVLGLASLGIDMAKLMTTRTQLQNAADAAALAGASAVDPTTGTLDPALAAERAQLVCVGNKAFIEQSEPVVLDAADVQLVGTDRVRVTVRRQGGESIVTYFARVMGVTALEMTADATAKVDTAGAIDCGILPLAGIPGTGGFVPGCGNTYTLKEASQGGTTGNYLALSFPKCAEGACSDLAVSGANTYRCLVQNGYCCSIAIGQELDTEPGNMAGPTTQAIKTRFSEDTDQRINICYSDYTGNGRRVAFVPIVTAPSAGGRSSVTVTGFAAFFLKNIPTPGNGNSILAEYVYSTIPGSSENANSTGPIVYTVRLVE